MSALAKPYVSPYVAAAAERCAYRSPLEMPVRVPVIHACPCCNRHPAIDPEFHNQVCIYCDFDDCTGKDMQAMGDTLEKAAAKWNVLGSESEAGDAAWQF